MDINDNDIETKIAELKAERGKLKPNTVEYGAVTGKLRAYEGFKWYLDYDEENLISGSLVDLWDLKQEYVSSKTARVKALKKAQHDTLSEILKQRSALPTMYRIWDSRIEWHSEQFFGEERAREAFNKTLESEPHTTDVLLFKSTDLESVDGYFFCPSEEVD